MIELTKKQQRIYDYIVKFKNDNGYPPAVREIADGIGLRSPATVHAHINNLVSLGVLKKDSSKNRALSISDYDFESEASTYDDKEGIEYINVPVVGKVAAGEPILAVENIERTFPLPMDFAKNKDVYMLKVKGDSMINIGIFDGDYVIVERNNVARNGEVIVALIDDSATVKTFYEEKGHYRLQPENDSMEPIIVNELSVLGKVVGLFRMM